MKILRVVSDLYPFVVGGIGIHAHEMSKLQAEKGNCVDVITLDKDIAAPTESFNEYGITKLPISFQLLGNSFSVTLPFRLWEIKNQHDIVHAHSHLFFSTVVCAIIRRFSSTPLVITNHGLVSQTAPKWVQQIYMSSIGKWTLQSADKVLCYTQVEKDQLLRYGIPEDKIAVIHNGISTVNFTPSDTIKNKQILWIGRFTPGKGVDVLINAFKIFHDKFPDYTLLMIGRGPLKNEIQQLIQVMELEGSIQLTDFVPNENLPQIYQNSILFVLPSFEEGVPRTILEAMSCEIPVVCSDLPQLRDLVNECGIQVPIRDPIALADALCRVITDREFAKTCGMNGRIKIVSQYSWDDTVDETLACYEDVIRSRNHQENSSIFQMNSTNSEPSVDSRRMK